MRILLHICCSNCVTYPFRILGNEGHQIRGLWFNPNIHPSDEYSLRLQSLKGLASKWQMDVIYEGYEPERYFELFGLDGEKPEGLSPEDVPMAPERCSSCYHLRLRRTAEEARRMGFDAFTTTLLISPYQDFERLIQTGRRLADEYNVEFYLRDFRVYFKDSQTLSRELGLYRQKYCGCIFSRMERNRRVKK
jgi:hypothetical protein